MLALTVKPASITELVGALIAIVVLGAVYRALTTPTPVPPEPPGPPVPADSPPDDADALAERAQLHLEAGRLDDARRDLDRALIARTSDANLFARRADLRALSGDLDGAAEDASSALAINPRLTDAYACRAYCNILRERYADALADADAGLANDNGDYAASLYNNRAKAFHGLHRDEEALAAIDAAIAIDGSVPKFHENRASILRALGRDA